MIEALAYLLGAFAYIVVFFAIARLVCRVLGNCIKTRVDYRATKQIRSMNATLTTLTGEYL